MASVSSSQAPTLKTLAQKKKETVQKYPNACSLKEASLFYPTSLNTMHSASINVAHVSVHMKIGTYKGYYRCAHPSGCDYAAQMYGIVTSHIRCVHEGVALGCRFCPTLAWWQARYWSEHMDKKHHDQPKYEPLILPEGELKAEEVDADEIQCTQHMFSVPSVEPPVPIHKIEPRVVEAEVHSSSHKRSWTPQDSGITTKALFVGSDLEEVMESDEN